MFYEVEQHIALLEAFVASSDKPRFIESLNNPTEKMFLNILTSPVTDIEHYKKELKKLEVTERFKQAILKFKLKQFIEKVSESPSKKIIQQLKQLFSPYANFIYEKPANIRKVRQSQSQDNSHKVNLSLLSKDLSDYINYKVLEDSNFLNRLEPLGISLLTEKTLLSLEFRAKEKFFRENKYIYLINPLILDNVFQDYVQGYKKENISSEGIETMPFPYQKLTKQQLNFLSEHNNDIFFSLVYCREWINQNFKYFSSQYSQASSCGFQREKYFFDELIKFKKDIKKHGKSVYLQIFQHLILTEIMATEIELKSPLESRLIEFLNNQLSNYFEFPFFTEKFKSKFSRKISMSKQILQFVKAFKSNNEGLRGSLKGVVTLADEYIIELFKKEKNCQALLQNLGQMIQLEHLKQLEVKAKLMMGVTCEDATDFWTHNQLAIFKEKKQLKISDRNEKTYKAEDDVFIVLNVKNIQQLQIKVYELNLLKEYLTNNSQDNNTYDLVNLSYFNPTSTDLYINPSQNPFEVKQVKIEIKSIPKRIGTFVVDFQGQDITSRAVIRKGAILCLESYSEKGQTFSFFDQEGKELNSDSGLELWVEKNRVSLTEGNKFDSSSIEVEKRKGSTEIIASLGCFAQKFAKNTIQQYNLSLKTIYNSESFIKESKAKVILKAALNLNNSSISMKKLQNIKAVLSQYNGNVITSSSIFEFTSWVDNQEHMIQFFPQSDIHSISIQIKAEVEDQKKISVNSNTQTIKLSSIDEAEQSSISQLYLRQTKDNDYEMVLIGKNGEGVSQKEINLTFQMKGTAQNEMFKFVTDQEGKIVLGKLSSVKSVHYSGNSYMRAWNIDQTTSSFNYERVMYAFPGEQVTIPVPVDWLPKDIFLLQNLADGMEKKDETQSVKIGGGQLSFTVSEKKTSSYRLSLLPINFDVTIEVINQGIKWSEKQQGKQIVVNSKQGKISEIERGTRAKNIFISQLIVMDEQQDHRILKIGLKNIEDLSKSELQQIRIHVLATNFISPNIQGGFHSCDHFTESKVKSQLRQLNKSTYLSNKTLSEEAAYILNRQKQTNRIGSNLSKPGIFLKRLAVRDTSNVVGELGKEGNFQNQSAKGKFQREMYFSGQRPLMKQFQYITKHNSFLGLSGFALHNIPVDGSFKIPKGYSHLQVILITPENGTKVTFGLSEKETKVKDIRYKGLPDCSEGKVWNISRQVYSVSKQSQTAFSKKCEFKAVTLTEVFEYCEKVIFSARNEKLYDWKENLILWGSFSEQKKMKFYNKYYCHELNTFLKFKDESFFASTVKPFLLNKFKKSFIDLCLLQDQSLKSSLNMKQLLQLNHFECALLVHSLMRLGMKDEAKKVTERLEFIQFKNIPFKIKSNNFDYIINSYATKEQVKAASPAYADECCLMEQEMPMLSGRRRSEMAIVPMRGQMRARSESSENDDRSECLSQSECCFVPPSKKLEVESTKQYTQMTYFYQEQERYPLQQKKLINSPFWTELARHFLDGGDGNFTSSSFTQFNNGLQAMLAAAFIPGSPSNSFTLEEAGDKYQLKASIPLSLFLKEQKQYPFQQKDGVYIYQTVTTFSPLDPNKEIVATQIKAGEQYTLSTIFSNSTSDSLELQIVCPIPQGSVPLKSKEVTILQKSLGPFKTDVFKQKIYFPSSGLFKLPSANILNMESGVVISRSPVNLPLAVIKAAESKNRETFQDVIQFGTRNQILQFLRTKNIFSRDVFKPNLILWMLVEPSFYEGVTDILRERLYFEPQVWKFSLLHGHVPSIREYLDLKNWTSLENPVFLPELEIGSQAFEYFPYFQKRTHRYASQSRSAIKCVDLKETYIKFLIYVAVCSDYKEPKNKIAHAYYLILQDRLREAQAIVQQLTEEEQQLCQLQLDYIRCFLDMGLNGENCEIAKAIAPKYSEYPIITWRKLFLDIVETLSVAPANESQKKERIETKVWRSEDGDICIKRAPGKQIRMEVFPTNMELFFSEHAFEVKTTISNFSISKPEKEIIIEGSRPDTEITIKKEEFNHIMNPYLEISEHSTQSHNKIKSILWTDPRISTRIYQQEGVVQVFVNSVRASGCYVKVFTLPKGQKRPSSNGQYYVDGYTDIAGKFRYGLTDLQKIEEFALLIITSIGAVVKYAVPGKVSEEGVRKNKCVQSSSSDSDSDSSSEMS